MTQPYDERPDRPTDDAPEAAPAQTGPAESVPAESVPAETGPDLAPGAASADEAADEGADEGADKGADKGPTTSAGGFGDPRVDDAVARLQELDERPVSEHAEVFDDIHRQLRDALEEAAVEPAEEPRG